MITALYGRKSLYVKDSISVEMQLKKGRELCDKEDEIVEYIDEGFSGKNMKRPAFINLMEEVKNNKVSKIIVYKIDRFSRSLADFSQTWDILNEHNVAFISVKEQFDTSTPMGKAMLFILMVFAQLERETVAERVTDNYYERVKLGSWPGGPAPYGFDIGRISNTFLLDKRSTIPTLIPNGNYMVVERIFKRYCNPDISLGQIAKELLEMDVQGIKSKTWTNVALARLLRNPSYVKCDVNIYAHFKALGVPISNSIEDFNGEMGGLLVGKRGAATRKRKALKDAKFSLGNWKGFISSDVYLTVQHKLEKNEQLGNSGKGKHTWMTGIIKCGYCGRAMIIAVDGNIRRFKCSGRIDHICDHLTKLKLNDVEMEVQNQIIEVLNKCASEPVIQETTVTNEDKMQLTKIEEKIANFMDCIALGQANEITLELINREILKLTNEQQELLQKVNNKRIRKVKMEKIDFRILNFESKRLIAHNLIEKVNIFEKDIEIVWIL